MNQQPQINKLLLFISTVPQAKSCKQLMSMLREVLPYLNGLLQIIRLDTDEARKRVAKGKYFNITQVPSLVVILNGTIQLYTGVEKIVSYINILVNPPPPPQDFSGSVDYQNPKYSPQKVTYDPDNFDVASPPPPKQKKKIIIDDSNDNEVAANEVANDNELAEVEEDDRPLEESDFIEPPPKPKKGKAKSTKQSKTKKDVEQEFPVSEDGAVNRPSPKTSEIKSKADEMAAQFNSIIDSTGPPRRGR